MKIGQVGPSWNFEPNNLAGRFCIGETGYPSVKIVALKKDNHHAWIIVHDEKYFPDKNRIG